LEIQLKVGQNSHRF